MEIILIVAMTTERVIGRDNTIPWHIPGEQKFFKEVTMGHAMIMGRRTYESIGRPLPGRRNIILTRQQGYQAPGCQVCSSQEEALALCSQEEKVFIIGGGGPFKDGLAVAHTLILTVLDEQIEGDTWFPEFSLDQFPLHTSHAVEGPRPYTINTHKRVTSP